MSIDRAEGGHREMPRSRRAIPWPSRVIVVSSSTASTGDVPARRWREAGLVVVRRPDAPSALVELGRDHASLVVAPTDLRGMKLADFVEVVRSLTGVSVIIALVSDHHRAAAVEALAAGARGVVGLPLDPHRIAEELRGLAPAAAGNDHLVCGHVELSWLEHRVWAGGEEVRLSPKEFAVLHYLLSASPRAVPMRELVDRFENGRDARIGRLRVTIAKIRSRLAAADPRQPSILHTVRGVGYRVSEPLPADPVSAERYPNFPET